MRHYLNIVAVAFCFTALPAFSVFACIADFSVDIDLNDKSGNDVVLHISEGLSGNRSSIYYYKNDFDGSVKMVTLALAAKNLDDQQLQSLKKHLRDSLAAFIKYWDNRKLKKKISKSTKEAIANARKLLAELKDNKLSESHIESLLNDVVAKINNESAGDKRVSKHAAYDKDGKVKGPTVSSRNKNLSAQFPKGLYASAMDREVNRGGDIFGKNEGVCGDHSFAGQVAFRPQRPKGDKEDVVPPPQNTRDKHSQGLSE